MDKEKIYKCLKEKAKAWTIEELKEKIAITRQTQLEMFNTFQNVKGVITGERYINIFQNELKDRGIEYNGKDKMFLEIYYGLAEIIAEDYEQFEEYLKIIGEGIE